MFTNSVKRHICDAKNREVWPFRESFIFRENKARAKITEFTVYCVLLAEKALISSLYDTSTEQDRTNVSPNLHLTDGEIGNIGYR